MKKIKRCTSCLAYTLKESCPLCKASCVNPAPARFSPDDHYGKQRREMKKEAGLL